jgi:hypothetical protein
LDGKQLDNLHQNKSAIESSQGQERINDDLMVKDLNRKHQEKIYTSEGRINGDLSLTSPDIASEGKNNFQVSPSKVISEKENDSSLDRETPM